MPRKLEPTRPSKKKPVAAAAPAKRGPGRPLLGSSPRRRASWTLPGDLLDRVAAVKLEGESESQCVERLLRIGLGVMEPKR